MQVLRKLHHNGAVSCAETQQSIKDLQYSAVMYLNDFALDINQYLVIPGV